VTLTTYLPNEVFCFLLVMARVGTTVMLLPGFAEAFIPMRFRLAIALGISLVIMPTMTLPTMPNAVLMVFVFLAREIFIGMMLGMIGKLLLAALDAAGMIIATQSGIASAMLLNPSLTQQGGITSVFLTMVGVMAVLAGDLHHLPLIALRQSYHLIPIMGTVQVGDMAYYMATLIQQSFTFGVQLSAPLLVVGLVFHLGLGILNRLIPQIQVYFVAVSAQMGLGIFIFWLSLAAVVLSFLERFQGAYQGWFDF
jgi:flagellar biosynthesis protein FliR